MQRILMAVLRCWLSRRLAATSSITRRSTTPTATRPAATLRSERLLAAGHQPGRQLPRQPGLRAGLLLQRQPVYRGRVLR